MPAPTPRPRGLTDPRSPGALLYPPVPPGNSHKMPNAGGGDPARPWAREQREQPLHVCGGVHTCVAGVCSCTGDFARGCGCTQVCARGPGCRVCACMGMCVHGTRVCELLRVCPVLCSHSVGQGGRWGLAVPCHPVSHRVVPCHTALCHVTPCHAMSPRAMPSHAMPCQPSHNPVPAPLPLSLPCPPPREAPIGVVLPQSGCPRAGSPQHSVPPTAGCLPWVSPGGRLLPPGPAAPAPPFYSDLHVF